MFTSQDEPQAIKAAKDFVSSKTKKEDEYIEPLMEKEVVSYKHQLKIYSSEIEADPNNGQSYYNRAFIYMQLSDYVKSIYDYTMAIKIKPNAAHAYYNRALVYEKIKKYQESLADYTTAIELDPIEPKNFNNRGIIYTYLNELQLAINDFDRAIALKPDYRLAYYHRATVYEQQGNLKDAAVNYQHVKDLGGDNFLDTDYRYAFVENRKKNYAEALKLINIFLQYNPKSQKGYMLRAYIYSKTGNLVEYNNDVEKIEALKLEDQL